MARLPFPLLMGSGNIISTKNKSRYDEGAAPPLNEMSSPDHWEKRAEIFSHGALRFLLCAAFPFFLGASLKPKTIMLLGPSCFGSLV